jgi:hypothetical protein
MHAVYNLSPKHRRNAWSVLYFNWKNSRLLEKDFFTESRTLSRNRNVVAMLEQTDLVPITDEALQLHGMLKQAKSWYKQINARENRAYSVGHAQTCQNSVAPCDVPCKEKRCRRLQGPRSHRGVSLCSMHYCSVTPAMQSAKNEVAAKAGTTLPQRGFGLHTGGLNGRGKRPATRGSARADREQRTSPKATALTSSSATEAPTKKTKAARTARTASRREQDQPCRREKGSSSQVMQFA